MFHNVTQNTDEWLALRAGKLTGSSIAKVMADYGKAFGEPAKKLAIDIALAQVTGAVPESGFSNAHTERGHEQEPLAVRLYEDEYFCTVDNGGFFDNGFTGCSPDGIVGDKLIEVKSAIPSVHYARIKSQTFDSSYKWQLLFNMRESEREQIDFISYCPLFPENKKLFVVPVFAKNHKEKFEQMEKRINEFRLLVDGIKLDIEA
jgi:hypothetical protein